MREITIHKANGLNEALKIEVLDEPGPGGANHSYRIEHPGPVGEMNPSNSPTFTYITFQNGPIAENGVNGISNEALLAIVADRLECFQSGEYACQENGWALTHIQEALHWLHKRTKNRVSRGVEGTSQK